MNNEQLTCLIDSLRSGMNDDQAQYLIDEVTEVPEDRNEKLWTKNILDAAIIIKQHKGAERAITMIKAAYKSWLRDYPTSYSLKTAILKELCILQILEKKQKDAHATMDRYLYNALKQVSALHHTPRMRYFSFRGFSDYSLKDIEEEQISLAHPREFNDPLDTILVWWLENEIKKGELVPDFDFKLLMKKSAEHIKIRCMIGSKYENEIGDVVERKVEDLSVLMWAHYAKSHTGFCVEYDFEKTDLKTTFSSDENRLDMIQAISYVPVITLEEPPSMAKALFQKSNFWDYENEMRLCSFDTMNDNEFPVIKCPGAIKAVYLGAKCNDENRRKMEKAIGNKDIPLYQMSVNEEKLTRFKKIQIG